MEARVSVTAPLRFEPILKRLIWGGRRLGTELGKAIGPELDYAESWELSDHRNGRVVVAEGPMAGRSLGDLLATDPSGLLGTGAERHGQFPLLVKFIDARETLSVQVHPDDGRGRRLADDNGKTEAWVILAAEPGSVIYAGLRPGVGPEEFERAMRGGEVEPLLHRFPARPGDCVFIPAGTVHAIGAGVLLAEVQQMSDATFRVHDWGRLGADGKPRALHPDESMECIDFGTGPVSPVVATVRDLPGGAGRFEELVRCPEFRLERWCLEAGREVEVDCGGRFLVLIGAEGEAVVEHGGRSHSVARGRTLLLPAAAGKARLIAGTSPAAVIGCTRD